MAFALQVSVVLVKNICTETVELYNAVLFHCFFFFYGYEGIALNMDARSLIS